MTSNAAAKVSRRKRGKVYSREVLRLRDCFGPGTRNGRNLMEPEITNNVFQARFIRHTLHEPNLIPIKVDPNN